MKNLLQIAPLRKWLQVEANALDYFTVHSSYEPSQITKDLANTSIHCADLPETAVPMIDFYRKYKGDYKKHIAIK